MGDQPGPSLQQVLLVASGLYHPGPLLRARLARLVRSLSARRVTSVWLSDAPRAVRTTTPQVIIAFFHAAADKPRIVGLLEEHVRQGGTLIAVHGPLASFKGNETWEQLLGVRFSGHGPVHPLAVVPTPRGRRDGVALGETAIVDEQYRFIPVADTTVLATADGGGNPSPAFWVRESGEGRVICLALGHHRRAVGSPVFRELLGHALRLAGASR